ncbi:MAG: carbohydrate kinase family protein [Anaerolineae bacterium]|nr:carbohydrate kinase family protein [Anaerolineae bacterium]
MSNENFDVVVVGNVGIDTCVYFYGDSIDFNVEANFTQNVDYVGQAGGFASRGYAQLGKRTAFIGHVGDDFGGRFIREEFARDGIDMAGLFVDPLGTSRSINFMYHDGRRKNFYDGKGHMDLHPDEAICRQILSKTKLAHFNIPNWARYLLPIAREYGVTVACDLQDTVSVEDGYRQDFIRYADILFCSAVNQPPHVLIEAFLRRNSSQLIVVGMGAQGCALGSREGIQYFSPVSMDAPVIDTNGAGDGLAVGFLTGYILEGYSLQDAILRGQIVARHTCTQKASSSHLITPAQLQQHYERIRKL